MPYSKYVEGKYACNHPESDFARNSEGPIEMKKENFVEYTHRNETANLQYDVWGNSNSTARLYKNDGSYKNGYYNMGNLKRTNDSKKGSGLPVAILIILIYVLPIIFSIIAEILE